MKKIFGLVGHIGSGKGVACEYLHTKYGAGYHKFSTMLRDILHRLYLPIDRDHLIRLSETLRREFGEDTFARVMKDDVLHDTHDVVCVDGIRRLADIAELQKLPGFTIVFIDADVRTRYERIMARTENQGDTSKTFEEFLEDEKRSTERSIDEVAAIASITLTNNGSLEEFHAQLDTLMK